MLSVGFSGLRRGTVVSPGWSVSVRVARGADSSNDDRHAASRSSDIYATNQCSEAHGSVRAPEHIWTFLGCDLLCVRVCAWAAPPCVCGE